MREQFYLARALFKTFAFYAKAIDNDVYNSNKKSLFYVGDAYPDRVSTHRAAEPVDKYSKIIKADDEWVASDVDMMVSQGGLDMRYGFDISIETKDGRVRPDEKNSRKQGTFHYSGRKHSLKDPNDDGDRDYWSTEDSKGYDELVIRVHKNQTQYQEMIITGYRADYDMGKYGWAVGGGAPLSMNKIVLPFFVIHDTRFTEYVTISDHSFALFVYAIKTVEISWWKFFISLAIAIAVCMFTAGMGCNYMVVIIEWIINTIIMMALNWLLSMIDSEMLTMIVQIAMQVYSLMSLDLSALTTENFLKLATDVSTKVMGIQAALTAEDDARKERDRKSNENIDEKIENVESSLDLQVTLKMSMQAHSSFEDQNNPDAFYANMLGNGLFNFDQFYDVDREIEMRKQVVSG